MTKLVQEIVNLDGDIYRLYENGKGYRSVQNSAGFDKEMTHVSIQAAMNSSQRNLFKGVHVA